MRQRRKILHEPMKSSRRNLRRGSGFARALCICRLVLAGAAGIPYQISAFFNRLPLKPSGFAIRNNIRIM